MNSCTKIITLGLLQLLLITSVLAQEAPDLDVFTIGRIKYGGGGDWYSDPSALPNLLGFLEQETGIKAAEREVPVEPSDRAIFNLPYLYLTGHGNVKFTDEEAANLRRHLTSGGFLHVDDNYGLDEHFRREIKKVFPNARLEEIPYSHPIFHSHFDFANGLPKIHEHDNMPPQGFGIFYEGEMVLFYTYECDLGDGWEDPDVHHDPEEVRIKALKMGVNIIVYALQRFN
ncbi:hypothetical protein CEE37_03860 [candidate division LCP-89 bacterium B3_LCP]|uniref:DUF4159 domain-containing protein n=1 Tax=candidate division LCP-89 bacterium B3_LCP TaxID=2012998 RepID=A0A532V3K9_UNCL8|nr:MAG: hypothetical protein CEE37_03860 [candidate division LCP-89 bacterium B3_LCP]